MAKPTLTVKRLPAANPIMFTNTSKITKTARKAKAGKVDSAASPHKSTSDIFGKNAPDRRLRLPQAGNLTAAEQVTFLPNWLRSHDVLYRFVQNGADVQMLAKIVNHNRRSTKGHDTMDNSVRKLVQKTMRESGYNRWTTEKHKAGLFRKNGEIWDKSNLTLTGGKVHCEDFPTLERHGGPPVENVDFASLANDVEIFPSEETGDGLDLTRCIKAAVANRHLALKFPRDFGFLTNLLGGPRAVQPFNLDGAVFSRWQKMKKATKPTADQVRDSFRLDDYTFTPEQEAYVRHYLAQIGASTRSEFAEPTVGLQNMQVPIQDNVFVSNNDRALLPPFASGLYQPQNHISAGLATSAHAAYYQPVMPWPKEDAQDVMRASNLGVLPRLRNTDTHKMSNEPGGYMRFQDFGHISDGSNKYFTGVQDNANTQFSRHSGLQSSIFSAAGAPTTVSSSPPSFNDGGTHLSSFDFRDRSLVDDPAIDYNWYERDYLFQGLNSEPITYPPFYRQAPVYGNLNGGFPNESYFGHQAE